MTTKKCESRCPNCGKSNLDYEALEGVSDFKLKSGDSITYPFTCPDCKTEGYECYIVNYSHSGITRGNSNDTR